MAETADNHWRSMSLDSDGQRQSTENSNTNSPGSELSSAGTPASRPENRRRISIAEYKQRKKSTELNASINNNNNNSISNPNDMSFDASKSKLECPSINGNPPIKNGLMSYGSLEEYHAHIYYFQNYFKDPLQGPPNLNNLLIAPTPVAPRGIQSAGVYAHGNDMINSTESRLHRVEGWNTNPTVGVDPRTAKADPQIMDNSMEHGGESPINRNGFPIEISAKPVKVTAASALDDPNECKSYREWKKRKYGVEDLPSDNWGNDRNSGKIRKVGGWKNKGPRDNERRQRNNRNGNNNDSWDTPGPSHSNATESWDDEAPVPQSSAAVEESWDDDSTSAPPRPAQVNLESWDEDPPPQSNKNSQINLESWDDAPAPAAPPQINLESWDEEPAAQVNRNAQRNSGSWDKHPAPRRGNRNSHMSSESWDQTSSPQINRNSQLNLESWDDDPSPQVQTNSGSRNKAPAAHSVPQNPQINLESWDDDPAPLAQANRTPQINLESWDDNPASAPAPPPQVNRYPQINLESWDEDAASQVHPNPQVASDTWNDTPASQSIVPNNSQINSGSWDDAATPYRDNRNSRSWDNASTSQDRNSRSWDKTSSRGRGNGNSRGSWNRDRTPRRGGRNSQSNSGSWNDAPASQNNRNSRSWDKGSSRGRGNRNSRGTSGSWGRDATPRRDNRSSQNNSESWDESPATSTSNRTSQINFESWDDAPASSGVTENPQINLESWDDDPAPQPNKNQSNSSSWAAPRATQNSQINLESWDDAPASTSINSTPQINLESWDDDAASNVNQSNASDTSSWPVPQPPAPVPANLDSWDNNPTPPQPPTNIQTSESWDSSAPAPPRPPKAPRNSESWEDDIVESPKTSWGDQENNSQDWTSRRSGNSGPNSRSRKFANDNGSNRDSSQAYQQRGRNHRSGSRSSDTSDSSFSRQNFRSRSRENSRDTGFSKRGNRGNGRQSGSRDSRQNSWGNRSRDNSGSRRDRQDNQGRGGWHQDPVPLPPVAMDPLESWDDDAPVEKSSETPNLPPVPVIQDPTLESWDDPPPPADDVTNDCTESMSAKPSDQENYYQRDNYTASAVCTTCSYQLSHNCKYLDESTSLKMMKPGELYKCQCGLVFLHAGNCTGKMDQTYAPINSETGLFKQVGRSHIYLCNNCQFKFIIDNIKDGTHYFSQLTTKKGDKIRENIVICDPQGIQQFMFFIEKINDILCHMDNSQVREQFLKQKISNICHCNQGCCTIYHNCSGYAGNFDNL